MSNEIQRLVFDPDTHALVDLLLSEEDLNASLDNPQIIRDKIAQKVAAEAAKQSDLNELRSAKVTAALTSIATDAGVVDTDLLAIGTATAAQVRDIVARSLQREKKALQREQAIIKALMRLVG